MRPVLEEEAAPVDEPVEPRALVGAEAAPEREVVRAVEDVDRVELEAARVLDELDEPPGGQPAGARARQMLPLEEERGDRAEGERRDRHAREAGQGARRTRRTDTECAGNSYSRRCPAAGRRCSRTPTAVRMLEGVRGADLGAVDLGDVELSGRRGAAQVDRRRVAPVAVAVDDPDRELAPALVAGRDGVEEGERPEVGDVVDAAERPLLEAGRQGVTGRVDVDVERDRPHVLGVEAQRMVDGLEEQALRAREDRGDRVDELGEVGHPDDPAVADEAVEVGGHRQRVREVVALLDAAHPVLLGPRPVPDVPLVERDVDRMGEPLRVAGALDQGRADADGPLRVVRLEDGGVVIRLARVEMDAVPVDDRGEPVDHDLVPVAPAVVAAADELDLGIGALHDEGEGPRLLDVVLGAQVPDLPASVHLVAEAPVAHAVGLGVAVGPPEVRPVGVPGAVAVLHPGLGLVHRARAHVHADVRLRVEDPAVLDELVRAEAVRLLRVPRELAAPRPVAGRADAVGPVVPAHEVAARPAEHRHAERADRLQHVPPEAARIAERRALLEDAAVDAAAEVLDEVAEDPPIHGADPAGEVDARCRAMEPLRGGAPGTVNAIPAAAPLAAATDGRGRDPAARNRALASRIRLPAAANVAMLIHREFR